MLIKDKPLALKRSQTINNERSLKDKLTTKNLFLQKIREKVLTHHYSKQ